MDGKDFCINSRAKIISLLNGLRLERTHLDVTLEGVEGEWRTTLLKVDPDGDVIYFSLLGAPTIDQRLQDGDPFRLSGVLRGVPLEMTLQAEIEGDRWNASDILRFPIPGEIIYRQKRESVRIPLLDSDVEPEVVCEDWRGVGRLLDVSFTGCRIAMDPGTGQSSALADHDVTLKIAFPGAPEAVEIPARVVHVQTCEDEIWMGMEFGKTDLRTQNIIDRYVLEKQRNACRAGRAFRG